MGRTESRNIRGKARRALKSFHLQPIKSLSHFFERQGAVWMIQPAWFPDYSTVLIISGGLV
jgi:hypothetical protein